MNNKPFALNMVKFESGFGLVFSDLRFTPRNVKRYLNTIEVMLPLLRNYVNLEDFLYLHVINIGAPGLYELIRKNPEYFLQKHDDIKDKDKQVVRNRYYPYKGLLVRLFPYSLQLFSETPDDTIIKKKYINAEKEGRILTETFFEKYFMYNVPIQEISQSNLEAFREELIINADHTDVGLSLYDSLTSIYGVPKVNRRISGSALFDDIKFVVGITNVLIRKYDRLYGDRKHLNDLNNCFDTVIKCILRLSSTDQLKRTNLWQEDTHVILLLDLYNYWSKNGGDQQFIGDLKTHLHSNLNLAKINFIKVCNGVDASRLLQMWNSIEDPSRKRTVLQEWTTNVWEFEDLLRCQFSEIPSGNVWGKLFTYVKVVELIPVGHIFSLVKQYRGVTEKGKTPYVKLFVEIWDTVYEEFRSAVDQMIAESPVELVTISAGMQEAFETLPKYETVERKQKLLEIQQKINEHNRRFFES